MTSSDKKLRVAVIGCGGFGRNHARVYRLLQSSSKSVELAGVVDSNPTAAQAVAAEFQTQAFSSLDDLKDKIDAASVAVPTVHHLTAASELMRDGIDVLIEKPLAATLAEADELVGVAREYNRIAQV